MPKKGVHSNSPARKKAKPTKKTQISVASGSDGFIQRITISKEGRLLEKDILLGEEIYGTDVPEEMEGKLFHYVVQGYDNRTKKFSAQYKNRMIDKEGASWQFQDGGREMLDSLDFDLVSEGEKLYNVKYSDVRTNKLALADASKAILKEKERGAANWDEEVDCADLVEAAGDEGNWFGMAVIEAMFELTGESG